jgi:uncharacterized protein with PIN domain/sulfur carrier protein ThiS
VLFSFTGPLYHTGVPPAAVSVRFYEELNDFLPASRRKTDVHVTVPAGATVKALVEDLGVPHTQVDLLLVNGESVGFDFRLSDGDRVSVYPVFESMDVGGVSRVRPAPLRETRFVLDVHLGKLARLLRMLGFDAALDPRADDEAIARTALRERRIILSRDRGLLKRRIVTHGYLVRETGPGEQAAEVMARFDLRRAIRLFGRCMRCNVPLRACTQGEASARVPPAVAALYDTFHECPGCGRVYWKGSHWEAMRGVAEKIQGPPPEE